MNRTDETVCVILAGGQGKRMASRDRHKVCFPIAGKPAIVRAIDTYKAAGLKRFLVVVGAMAEQVIATVSSAHPEATFVFQAEARGTGHAALLAAEALAAQGFRGDVMVVMGDKVTRESVVRDMLGRFADGLADLVMTTLPKTPESTAGRVVTDRGGRALGVVEVPDIQLARRKRRAMPLAGRKFTAAQIERNSCGVNGSLYVFRFDALYKGVGALESDNAQGELYLTDTVEYLARRGRVETMDLTDPRDLMAYNTPAELMAIEEVVREWDKPPRVSLARKARRSPKVYKPAAQWINALSGDTPALRKLFEKIYGPDATLIETRRKALCKLASAFARRHGPDRSMVLCRAPGRINLMGRHVDHRGGFVNVMAISRETVLAAAPRDDDRVALHNLDAKRFPDRQFSLQDILSGFSWTEWMEFLGSRAARSVLQEAPGDWSHYARAPLLRLQHESPGTPLGGMDCLVSGDIPMGAGLSSSSALVVAFAEAACRLSGLDVTLSDFIDLCGEGEWFVGSRGGSADHAAIRASRAGYVSRIGFFPFHLAGEVRFPPSLRVVIAHSGSQAVKTLGARDTFNQRVACYEIAQMLLRRRWPAAAGMKHLRDMDPELLKVHSGHIYLALKQLPTRPTRAQLREMLDGEDRDRLETLFTTHANIGPYDLRGVTLYGIGECIRSRRFAEILRAGDLDLLGQFMRASHDGDRVVRHAADGKVRKHVAKTDDATLDRLTAEEADLSLQTGRYACSTEAIDQLVDLADATEGVVGSQLAGAGLGGCMMVLVRRDALDPLMTKLRKEFYSPRKLPFGAHVCTPVAGAGLLRI